MRLDLHIHTVRELRWGDATRLEHGVLYIDRGALAAHLLEDRRLAGVELEIARPGESCRIVPVFDIAEPRAKLADAGSDFPGVIGPLASAGSGVTGVLRGMAVTMLAAEAGPTPSVLNMQPPLAEGGAELATRYNELVHLVVIPRLALGLERHDAANALRLATLRASVFLARAACVGEADQEERYELAPVLEALPRIAYVFQMHSHQRPTAPGEPIIYGDNARHLVPTILHPNEILDGAVLPGYNSLGIETYCVQNHAAVLDLYARHGRDLDFAGIVVTVAHQTVEERERNKLMAANLVRQVLRADGVLLSKSGGGAPHVDMGEVGRACERLGVKTTLMAWELSEGGNAGDGSALFNYPELDAIVNYGCNGFPVALPPVHRVITGGENGAADRYRGAMTINANRLCGAMDQLGSGYLTATQY